MTVTLPLVTSHSHWSPLYPPPPFPLTLEDDSNTIPIQRFCARGQTLHYLCCRFLVSPFLCDVYALDGISTPLKVHILLGRALGNSKRDAHITTSHARGMMASMYTCVIRTRAWRDMSPRKATCQGACLTFSDLTNTLTAKMCTRRPHDGLRCWGASRIHGLLVDLRLTQPERMTQSNPVAVS